MNGCAVRVAPAHQVEPEPVYLTAESVPVDVETYPSTTYEGHAVFLWNDRWYYRRGNGWVYYRNEPEPLHRHRETLHRDQPPPHRNRPPPPNHHDDRRDDEHGGDRR
jgi:trehalose utilization protein